MTPTPKTCPITQKPCTGQECAWWHLDEVYEGCAVRLIPPWLRLITRVFTREKVKV